MLWSISGGAGFLGLHLARRLLADGHDVRTLDVVPLDDAELERTVEELRGDIRDRESVRELVDGADVVVHAAAALPIQASRESILFDWIREGRRIYTLGKGDNRYQLLAVDDLVDAIMRAGDEPKAERETFNVGATDFGTVRSDLQALIDHADSSSRLQPVPVKPAEIALRGLELLRVSPLAEWHYKTAHKDSFVDVTKAQGLLGWQPRLSNRDALIETYDWYLANRGRVGGAGVTHRVPWNQQALGLLKRLS